MSNIGICIGARIPPELMNRIKETGLSNTEIINNALELYLNINVNTRGNHVNTICFDCKYQTLCKLMDKHLGANGGSL